VSIANPGDYDVRLKAISDGGCEAEWTEKIRIPVTSIVPSITTPSDDVCQGNLVSFVNASTPVPESSTWYFGSDPPVTGLTQFRRFNTVGQVNVTLVNKYGSCELKTTKTLSVKAAPGDQLSTPDNINCKTPHTQQFVYSGLPASQVRNIEWEFGDGGSASGSSASVSHTYNATGKFPIRMRVTDIFGCVTDKMFNERIIIELPRVDSMKPKALADSGCANLVYRPQIFPYSRDGIKSVTWDFGDGSPTVTGNSPSHTYTTPRTAPYAVKAVIETNNGCKIEENGLVYIGVVPGPSDFKADKFNVCAGSDTVRFSDQSAGTNITGWKWEFGDGVTSKLRNPSHSYTDTGYMNVKLTLFNNGCPNTILIKPRYIQVGGAISKFNYENSCTDKLKVRFINLSKNANTYSWSFGDGSTASSLWEPEHLYPRDDTFTVRLTVTGGGCKMESSQQIKVIRERTDFDIKTAFTNTFCAGNTMIFTALPKKPEDIKSYEWDFGDGKFVTGGITATYPYPNKGAYTTRLRMTDLFGCQEVVTKPPFSVGGPSADFSAPVRQGCTGLEVDFTDSSIAVLNAAIIKKTWDFGDGTVQTVGGTVTKVRHKYDKVGPYTVKLTVEDEQGCQDVIEFVKYVIISDPKIDFVADVTNSCPGKFVRFTNTTKMEGGRYAWDFGDGNTSPVAEPAHRFAAKGKYTITLNVVDGNGCAASFKRDQYINIDVPVADYDLSETYDDCPPMTPVFTFKGSYYEKIRWEFGDGGVSDLLNPKQVYLFPGNYQTRLIVTSPGGCQATATKTIVIDGPTGSLSADKIVGCDQATINFRISNAKDLSEVIWDFDESTIVNNKLSETYTYTKPGTYKPQVFLKNPKGCIVPYSLGDSVRVIGIDPGFLSVDSALCDKGQARFTDTTRTNDMIKSWLWDLGNGSTSTLQNPVTTYNGPGVYKVRLRVTTQEGCVDEVERDAYIRVVKSPEMQIDANPSVCQEGRIVFASRETTVPKDTSVLRYLWDFGNGQTSNLGNPSAQTYAASGNYTIRLRTTNSTGCTHTALKDLVVHPLPAIGGSDLETICLGQSVTLRPTGGVSYQWLTPNPNLSCTNCPEPVANPSVDTRYTVRATNVFGCLSDDSIWVRVIQPTSVKAPPNDSLCLGESAMLRATGTEVYSWSPPTGLNNPKIANPVANPTVSTRYTVTGTDRKGCFTTQDFVDVTVFPIPVANAGRDTVIFAGFSTSLGASYSPDVRRYEWTPATGLSCYDCPNPVASPKATTNYTVKVFNSGGCVSSDAVTVFVVCKNVNLYLPNTFSPNGDGMNDVFYPRGRGIQVVRSLKIFNRWGEQVFRRDNFNVNETSSAWDGRYKGRELAPDVYVYIIDVACDNNTIITLKGDVALVR
jgi:gliding motility-associated-like protein